MVDKQLYAKLKNKYKQEKVFVIPYNLVENIPDKFNISKENNILKKYDTLGKYIYRYDAEYNTSFQQIIPYVIITNEDESKYYVAKRIGGDKRLVNQYSLGFGGHINEEDGNIEVVYNALKRELAEELNLPNNYAINYIGTMRDISSETSEHFGLIFKIHCNEDEVSIKEIENLSGEWFQKKDLFDKYLFFENWSKYIIDYLYKQ